MKITVQTSARVRIYPADAILPADGFLPSADASACPQHVCAGVDPHRHGRGADPWPRVHADARGHASHGRVVMGGQSLGFSL
jgi:hypothetical protein